MTREEFICRVETFDGALDWAKSAILSCVAANSSLLEPNGFEKSLDRSIGINALKWGNSSLVDDASKYFASHQALRLGCAEFLREGRELPPWAKSWLADLLDGNMTIPPKPRGAPKKSSLHRLVCILIDNLVDAGWKALRNDASEETSACDVLALALRKSGLQPTTFDGVKRIYLGWNAEQYGNEKALKASTKRLGA